MFTMLHSETLLDCVYIKLYAILMTKSIICLNAKGGCSKTTTTVTLAHGLAIAGKSVLIVDLDSQGQCATLLGIDQRPGIFELLVSDRKAVQVIRKTGRDNLFIIPGNHKTNTAQTVITIERRPISDLRDKLQGLGYDYIVFDTAPSINELTSLGIFASNFFIIPTAVDFLSTEGIFKVVQNIKTIQETTGHTGKMAGIVPTFYDSTNETQATIADLNKNFPGMVLQPIHRATVLRECAAMGKTIFEVEPRSRAAQEYQALVKHILEVTK